MKKPLLFISALSFSILGTAQSLTQANEPAIGTTETMYLCDSNTVRYDNVTGTGITWDYTGLAGYHNEFRDVDVIAAGSTTYASDFPGATFVIKAGTQLTTYFSSTPTERVSQGFVFTEPTLGDVLAKFSSNTETVATYPFAYNDSLTDDFGGDLVYDLGLGPQTTPATGQAYAWIDGQGTLDLPGGVSLSNVIRYKIIDTSWANITLLGNLEFIRTQYEYYDHTVSDLPVLMMTSIVIQNVGAPSPVSEANLVLSQYEPAYLNVNENTAIDFALYPNPTKENLTITGDFTADAKATLLDQSGRVISSFSVANGTVVDMTAFENGMYFLRIEDQGLSTTKNVIKK